MSGVFLCVSVHDVRHGPVYDGRPASADLVV